MPIYIYKKLYLSPGFRKDVLINKLFYMYENRKKPYPFLRKKPNEIISN